MIHGRGTKFQVIFVLILVQILFGMNYVASKVIIGAISPLIWASLRNLVSALILFVIAVVDRRRVPDFNGSFWVSLVVFSLFGIVLNQVAFLVGLKYTTATHSAVLCTLIPVFTLLLVSWAGHEFMPKKRLFGFGLAFSGVLWIYKIEEFTFSNKTLLGDFLILLNAFSYAIFLTFGRFFIRSHDSVWITACLFAMGGLGLGLLAAPDWIHFQWPHFSPALAGFMVFSVLGCTLLAYFLNFWALARTDSSAVAGFIYFQPIVASIFAWYYLGETLTLRTFISSISILFGMILAL